MIEKFLENLQYFRKLKGYSQKDFAKKIKITPTTYSRLETGSVEITIRRLLQISKALERNPGDFFLEDPAASPPFNYSLESITMQLDLLKEMCNKNDILIKSLQENISYLKEKVQEKKAAKKSR